MRPRRLRRRTRLAAWLVTGPVGHAYGGVADVLGLLARLAWARARARARGRDVPGPGAGT